MKGTGGNEQDMVRHDGAMLGTHGGAFHDRQEIPLYSFS